MPDDKGAPQCQGHEDYWGWTFARYMYDLSFYIIIITVLLNIVLGIIIDGFGELRQKKRGNGITNGLPMFHL